MRTTQMGGAAGLGAMVFGCFGALAHCGGGSSGASPLGGDGGDPDATARTRDGGSDPIEDDGSGGAADVASPPRRRACASSASCGGPSTVACCDGYCVDTAKDPAHCGKCGVACTASQFCTGAACEKANIASVCANATGTVALDPYAEDNQAASAMGAALSADCVPGVSILQTSQSADGVLDPRTGRPITGPGNTFITGGGGYGQNGVKYMESSITPLYLWSDGTTGQIRTRAGKAIVTTPVTDLTVHHDFFYVQLSVEPQSGTLCFSSVGMLAPGTAAAGYYAGAEIIPNRAKYTATWYVYEWTDTTGDSIANAGDTFTQIMGGP